MTALAAVPVLVDNVGPNIADYSLGGYHAKKPAAKKRAKRTRHFILEVRILPSAVGRWFKKEPTDWEVIGDFEKLQTARNVLEAVSNEESNAAGFLVRGAEYRVRRTDTKVA